MTFRFQGLLLALMFLAVAANAQVVTVQVMPGVAYLEDFETESVQSGSLTCPPTTVNITLASLGWSNVMGTDSMDWTPDSNGTGSSSTGPGNNGGAGTGGMDHTPGTTAGIYLYTETSGSCNGGDIALLHSPLFDVSLLGTPGFDYYYHMLGATMGDLHTDVIEWFNAGGNGVVSAGSDTFNSNTSIFTAAHVGSTIEFTSGAQIGTYTIMSVIDPFNVQLDTVFASAETGIDFQHTMLHMDVIPLLNDNIDLWQNSGDININAILVNAGPGVDGTLRAFQAQLRSVSGTSFTSDMAVDTFRVREIPQIDFSVATLVAPVPPSSSACLGLGMSETITVELGNLSAVTVPPVSFPIEYSINGGSPVTDTVVIAAPVAPGNNIQHTFATPADLSALGGINVAITIFPGDGELTNNSNTFVINNPSIAPNLLPFFEDFETFGAVINGNAVPAGWINDSNDGLRDWLMENSSPSNNNGPFEDHTTLVSGAGIFAYVEDSTSDGVEINLQTPCIDLSASTNPVLDFWFNSNDAGEDQNPLSIDVVQANGVIVPDVIAALTGSTDGVWAQVAANLSAFTGTIVRVQFRGTDVNPNDTDGLNKFVNDFGIDDIQIRDITTVGLGQAPQPGIAVLDVANATEINGLTVPSGLPGIYSSMVNVGDNFEVAMSGEANQNILFLTGTVLANALNAPPFGQLDLTPVVLAADGSVPGFINSLFVLDATGNRNHFFPATSLLAGQTIGFQIIVFNTTSLFGFSNTVEVTFN